MVEWVIIGIVIAIAVAIVIRITAARIELALMHGIKGETVLVSVNDRKYNAFPKCLRTGDTSTNPRGAILATWYGGNAHVDRDSDGRIFGAFSHDEGHTWTQPFEIYDDRVLDCRNIGIARAKNDTVILFFAKVAAHSGASKANVWKEFGYITSRDHGHTWSAFTPLISEDCSIVPSAANGNGYGDPVYLDGGNTILIPCYGTSKDGNLEFITFFLKSTDNGETWTHATDLNGGTAVPTNEVDVWYDDDASPPVIFGFARSRPCTKNLLYYFESTDAGESWSLAPTPVWGHSPDILQLGDGRYLVTFRARTRLKNHYLGYFTLDGNFKSGTAFPPAAVTTLRPRCLARTTFGQAGGDMAYPSMVRVERDKILVVYYDIGAGGVLALILNESDV